MNRPCNVLFLCTGNSPRSILAEALLKAEAADLPARLREIGKADD